MTEEQGLENSSADSNATIIQKDISDFHPDIVRESNIDIIIQERSNNRINRSGISILPYVLEKHRPAELTGYHQIPRNGCIHLSILPAR